MGATSLTMSHCFIAGVFGRDPKLIHILAELGKESRGKKKTCYRSDWGKESSKGQVGGKMKLKPNHFILKPIKSTL